MGRGGRDNVGVSYVIQMMRLRRFDRVVSVRERDHARLCKGTAVGKGEASEEWEGGWEMGGRRGRGDTDYCLRVKQLTVPSTWSSSSPSIYALRRFAHVILLNK